MADAQHEAARLASHPDDPRPPQATATPPPEAHGKRPRRVRDATLALAAGLVLFGAFVAVALLADEPDLAASRWVTAHLDADDQADWRAASWPGATVTGIVLVALLTTVCLVGGDRRAALVTAATGAACILAVQAVKLLLRRDRPETALLESYSLPSGHTSTATVAWGLLAVVVVPALARRWPQVPPWAHLLAAGLAIGIAAMTGVARVLGGAHWPSDVAAGWAFGGALLASARLAWLTDPFAEAPAAHRAPPA